MPVQLYGYGYMHQTICCCYMDGLLFNNHYVRTKYIFIVSMHSRYLPVGQLATCIFFEWARLSSLHVLYFPYKESWACIRILRWYRNNIIIIMDWAINILACMHACALPNKLLQYIPRQICMPKLKLKG